jgi:hypothetical protein
MKFILASLVFASCNAAWFSGCFKNDAANPYAYDCPSGNFPPFRPPTEPFLSAASPRDAGVFVPSQQAPPPATSIPPPARERDQFELAAHLVGNNRKRGVYAGANAESYPTSTEVYVPHQAQKQNVPDMPYVLMSQLRSIAPPLLSNNPSYVPPNPAPSAPAMDEYGNWVN